MQGHPLPLALRPRGGGLWGWAQRAGPYLLCYLTAFALRAWGQTGVRVGDEAWSWVSLHDPVLLLADAHPPLYYLLFQAAHHLGASPQGWGYLHAALSAWVAPLALRLGGGLAGALAVAWPALVQDGAFARMYGPLDAAVALYLLGLKEGRFGAQLAGFLLCGWLHLQGLAVALAGLLWARALGGLRWALPLLAGLEFFRLYWATAGRAELVPAWGDAARALLGSPWPPLAAGVALLALAGLPRAPAWALLPLLPLLPLATAGYAKPLYAGPAALAVLLLAARGLRSLPAPLARPAAALLLAGVMAGGLAEAERWRQERAAVGAAAEAARAQGVQRVRLGVEGYVLRLAGYGGRLEVCPSPASRGGP